MTIGYMGVIESFQGQYYEVTANVISLNSPL